MSADRLQDFARLNGLRIAAKRFNLYRLAATPPPGGTPVNPNWPCAETATYLVDAAGDPTAIVVEPLPDHDVRRLGDLVRWLKIPAYTPPGKRADHERHFFLLTREGLEEPKWLPDLRQAA